MSQRLDFSSTKDSEFKTSVFETQIRRRVWWQILWVDGRTSQLASRNIFFTDSSDLILPANLNDADINPYMTELPPAHGRATEMIFCLTRYVVGMFLINHGQKLHNPATPVSVRDQLIDELEKQLERSHVGYCDPAIPLHRMAAGGARSAISRMRLIAHHPSRYPEKDKSMPQSEHDMIFATSVNMVESHIWAFTDKDVERFSWHLNNVFQLDAVVFMLIESHTQPPMASLTEKAWSLVSNVFKYRTELLNDENNELFAAVRQLVLNAWGAREREARRLGLGQLTAPPIIHTLKEISGRPELHRQPMLAAISSSNATESNVLNSPQAIRDSTKSVTEEPTNASDGQLFDWDMMDLQSWDFWDDMLNMQRFSTDLETSRQSNIG